MMRQFWWELSVGVITFAAMAAFGSRGAAAFALMAFLPFAMKNRKPDEREYYLFYKTGNYTMGLFILALVAINQLQVYTGSAMIASNWLNLSINSFLVIHGLTGIVIFSRS